MEFLTSLMARNGYLPHGYCFTWTPELLWSMVGADGLIAASYFSIPLAIVSFVRKRPDSISNALPWLFSAFIFACGITHLMDIWTIWRPDYGLQALTKMATAAISLATAISLWFLIPKALKIPSVLQLQTVIGSLEAEVLKRRSVEDHLQDTQQSLAVTLASIGAGFIATDRAGRVIRMNEVAEQVTGWAQAEAQGRILWEVFQREGRPEAYDQQNPVDLLIARQTKVDATHRITTIARDGRRQLLDLNAALTHANDGSVRGIAMVFRDMSRVLRAEADALQLAAIVESSSDAIIGKTLEGQITSWNKAATALFGYTAEDAIGMPVQALLPPECIAQEAQMLTQLTRGEVVPAFDTTRIAQDGSALLVSVTVSPIRDAQGTIVGASKIIRDISQRRQADEARRHAQRLEAENRQIHEANRLKSQFLANMSHELRTPLNAIIGFAELMHSGSVPPESGKQQQFLGHIANSGRHLLQLINDVLDLSKVESGKFAFYPEPVQLPELVAEMLSVLQTEVQRKRIRLEAEVETGLSDLLLDPARLKQVLYNYLSNAIKFTPEGGSVMLRARAEGAEGLRIEVEDSGIGIAAADLPRLFTEFLQLDAGYSKQHQGTGLGLALTRRLVEAQGGSVGVRSAVGVGSVFHLLLPRHAMASASEASVAVPELTGAASRLLVIGHDLASRDRLVRTMSEAGFQVDAAATGAEAVEQAGEQAYDAIMLGMQLPDAKGLSVLAHIRSAGPNSSSPVVCMTLPANTGPAASFAITDVLGKPLRADELAQVMARVRPSLAGQGRVLVVDDDPLALELMRSTLQSIGIAGHCVKDGRKALAELERWLPDAIILDLMMPEFDGFAVLDALRQLPQGANIPVFIWTSMELSDEEYASLSRSAQAIINKGGGELAAMLDQLRRWRPPPSPALLGIPT